MLRRLGLFEAYWPPEALQSEPKLPKDLTVGGKIEVGLDGELCDEADLQKPSESRLMKVPLLPERGPVGRSDELAPPAKKARKEVPKQNDDGVSETRRERTEKEEEKEKKIEKLKEKTKDKEKEKDREKEKEKDKEREKEKEKDKKTEKVKEKEKTKDSKEKEKEKGKAKNDDKDAKKSREDDPSRSKSQKVSSKVSFCP